MNAFIFERFSWRVQSAIVVSVILHLIIFSQLGPRRFSRPSDNMVITDVEYIQIAQPVSVPTKAKPKPKPKEIVDLENKTTPAETVAPVEEPEEPEPPVDQTGLAYNPYESQSGLFLPFYAVEEIPVFNSRIMPVYPQNAVKLNQTSKVVLEAYIDTTGVVRMIRIVKSGGEVFDKAAIEALKKSAFRPARINGKAVPVKILVPYVFSLES